MNAFRFTPGVSGQKFQVYALLLIALSSVVFAGCSALVNANANGGNPPTALTVSGVRAATPTTSGFQVNWSTNLAASSAVDYGTTANYGSTTTVNNTLVTSHQVAVTGLTAGTLYHFRARSTDASNGNAYGQDMTFATSGNTTPPSITSLNPVSGFVGTSVTIAGANFGATQGTSSITFNGTAATPTSWSAASITAAVPSGATTGNVVVTVGGAASNGVTFTVQADTTPPTVPTGLTATAISASQINLSWTASTDNVGVTGYNVFRAGVKLGTAPSTSYQDVGLLPSTSYAYTVSVFDAAGNTSAQSTGASATTLAATGGGGIPSTLGWYAIPNTTFIGLAPSGQTGTGCGADLVGCVTDAWNSGAADINRNRLYFTGGGHDNYSGNEVYALDLNSLTMLRLTNADPPNNSGSSTDPSGNPNSVHTYGGVSYIPSTDQLYRHAGAPYPTGVAGDVTTFLLSMSGLTWAQKDPVNGTPVTGNCCNYQSFADYDPVTDLVWYTDVYDLWTYNSHTNTQTLLSAVSNEHSHINCVVDYDARKFTCFGDSFIEQVDMTATTPTLTDITSQTSGCTALTASAYPGLAYDPVQKKVVAWMGGNTVYLFDSNTLACSSQSFTGGPVQANQGTFNRFRYFPGLGVFAVVNKSTANAYVLRMTPANPALNDFMVRCAQPGVVVCQGFDDPGGIPHNNGAGATSNSGADAGTGSTFPTQDTSITASGAGSMRFDLPTPTGSANPDGDWKQYTNRLLSATANSSTTTLFGQNSTFYVQFRQRMSPAYITNTWGGTFWKQTIFANNICSYCSQEITTVNGNNRGFFEMYAQAATDPLQIDLGNGDFLLEQGDTSTTGYNCHYQNPTQATCFYYQPNVFMTFYYKVHIGTFGQPNSSIQAWALLPGQGYSGHEVINIQNHTLNADGGNVPPGWNTIYLLPYLTGGYTGASGPATTWYDELLISSTPISAPNN